MSTREAHTTTLFLADDDESVRQTLTHFFSQCPGYRVLGTACDGAAAVEGCKRLRPDAALLDIQMPLLSGIDAARLILEEGSAKCVVMLTAFSDRDNIQKALDAGAFGYLTKPFEPDKILPTLEVCLSKSREHHLLRKEQRNLERKLNERERIDRAKLLLMESRGMGEEEAYRYIREVSRRKKLSMARVAEYLTQSLEGKT